MESFLIKRGVQVTLSDDNGNLRKIKCAKDTIFSLEQIIADPVSFLNEEENIVRLSSEEYDICQHSYIFKLTKGIHTNSNYDRLYVDFNDVKIL